MRLSATDSVILIVRSDAYRVDVFRLAVKRGVGSGYVFYSKQFTLNICVLTIKISTNIPMMNIRYTYKSIGYVL